jgi:hypothetical protein
LQEIEDEIYFARKDKGSLAAAFTLAHLLPAGEIAKRCLLLAAMVVGAVAVRARPQPLISWDCFRATVCAGRAYQAAP